MRDKAVGVGLLVVAVAIGWTIVAIGQAHAAGWIARAIGAARAQADPPLADTLFTIVIFGPLLVAGLIGGAIERRNALAAGAHPLGRLSLGLAAGFAGLTVAMLYAKLANALVPGGGGPPSVELLLWGLGVVALQTIAEEVYFRGWLQPALAARWGTGAALVAASLAFAGLHVAGGARAAVDLVNLFVGGLVFGLFTVRGRGIAGAVGVHLAWNASEQLVYGLDPNPGIGSFGALVDSDLAGAALWGGSSEGLNGSIGMTIVLLAILAPLAATGWRAVASPGRSTRPRILTT